MSETVKPIITPSNVVYLSCLRKFHALGVKKQYPGLRSQSPPLRFSNALHEALANVYRPKTNGPPPPHLTDLPLYLRAAFLRQPYRTEEDRAFDMERGGRLLRTYIDQDEEDGPSTIAVEVGGRFPIRIEDEVAFYISGRMDRLLVRETSPSELVARDYKFGFRALEMTQVWIDLALCKSLYPGYKAYTLEVDAITDDGVERVIYRSKDMKGIVRLVLDGVRRYMEAPEHLAEPGDGCTHCPLVEACQPHQAVDVGELEF